MTMTQKLSSHSSNDRAALRGREGGRRADRNTCVCEMISTAGVSFLPNSKFPFTLKQPQSRLQEARRCSSLHDPNVAVRMTRRSTLSMAADGGEFRKASVIPRETAHNIRPREVKEFSIAYDDYVIRSWRERDRLVCVDLIGSILKEYGLEWDPLAADRDVVAVEDAYRSGEFWVVEDTTTSAIVGTAAFYEVPHRGAGIVEIRKMYLHSSVRGNGLGSFLLSCLEQRALQLGYAIAVIETASVLKEACQMYSLKGYQPSTGIETERCDVVLEKPLRPIQPSGHEDHVEIIDLTRGWPVTCVSRRKAQEYRIPFRAVVVLLDSNGKVLVHKRSMKKFTYPGRMTALITGCVDWQEDPLTAARREVFEEVGIRGLRFSEPFAPFFAKGKDDRGQRIQFHPFVATGTFSEDDVVCNPDEVECSELMTRKQVCEKGIGGSLWLEFRAHGL